MTAWERASQLVKHWHRGGYDPFSDPDIVIEDVEACLRAHAEAVRETIISLIDRMGAPREPIRKETVRQILEAIRALEVDHA